MHYLESHHSQYDGELEPEHKEYLLLDPQLEKATVDAMHAECMQTMMAYDSLGIVYMHACSRHSRIKH